MTKIISDNHAIGSQERITRLTNFMSIAFSLLLTLTGLLLSIFETNETHRSPTIILIFSPFLLSPYILNRLGFINVSKLVLPIILPLMMNFLSIYSKIHFINTNAINAVNYFDIRFMLMSIALISLVTFNYSEKAWLILTYMPSAISILLYDPIHNFFNVGYYQVGLQHQDYYLVANLFTFSTFAFITVVIVFLNYQVYKTEYKQAIENKKLNSFLSELVRLSNSHVITDGKVGEAKIEILQTVKSCLNISRVSIWEYNPKGQYIDCEYLIDKNGISTPGTKLYAKNYPKYINAIQKETLIIAHNAEENIYTSEFTENYLRPLDIKSMMDAPYSRKGNISGVICCEQQHTMKSWGPAESILLKGLTDLLTYALLIEERKSQNQLLKEKNIEISYINKGLEGTIKKSTRELQEKNMQLTEYAYINSHILRAPVARISGLYNLLLMETKNILNDSNVLTHMDSSIAELEEVTKQINRAIEDHSTIHRNEF